MNNYTGIRDKNGVKLYEGDIIHNGDPNIKYTVVWDNEWLGKCHGCYGSYIGLRYWQDNIEKENNDD